MAASFVTLILCFVALTASDAFQDPATFSNVISMFQSPTCAKRHAHRFDRNISLGINRREVGAVVVATLTSIPHACLQKASAAMMQQPKEKFFEIGVTLNADIAKARFEDARRTLIELVNNYDSISKEGGDNVRRYLGTVGTSSAMYGIEKVLKDLQNEADDIVAYTENMNEFLYYLRAADTAVYSANFVEFSAAKTKPEKFFEDAKSDCKNILIHMDNMVNELNL